MRAILVDVDYRSKPCAKNEFVHYNFSWIHQTLRVTPAMEAGVTDHVWDIEEIAALLE